MASNAVEARKRAEKALRDAERSGITSGHVHATLQAAYDAAVITETNATGGSTGWGALG